MAREMKKELQEIRDLQSPRLMHYLFAQLHTRLGEPDEAFSWLERAYEDRDHRLVHLKVDPALDRLRADPRFADLLRRRLTP